MFTRERTVVEMRSVSRIRSRPLHDVIHTVTTIYGGYSAVAGSTASESLTSS